MTSLEIGQYGGVTTTPIHRRQLSTTRYRDVALVQHDGQWFATDDAEHSTPLELSRYRARTRYRDTDGRLRVVQAEGPSGAAARRNLLGKLATRRAPSSGAVSESTTIAERWKIREAELIADGKALRTLDTYRPAAAKIITALGGVKAYELTTGMCDDYLQAVKGESGPSTAQVARSVLSGLCTMAVRLGAMERNPMRDTRSVRPKHARSGTVPTVEDLVDLLAAVRVSDLPLPPKKGAKKSTTGSTTAEYCHPLNGDLADPITFMAGTGVRISDALAVRWSDLDLDVGVATIAGHVVSARGHGMVWEEGSKAGDVRTIALPDFVVTALLQRSVNARSNPLDAVFPNKVGNWQDPDNFRKKWRRVRGPLGFDTLTPHDFRRAVSTIAKDDGAPDRDTADHLGHVKVAQTHEYMAGGVIRTGVADILQARIGAAGQAQVSGESAAEPG